MALPAPFPWFGGKSRVAPLVWERFGDVRNYVEPFFGSGAMLLGRPTKPGIETANDRDGFLANFWRAVKLSPEETAEWADWPVNENDLHARHTWLRANGVDLVSRLEADPDWHDAKIAGWWVWGISCWIGGGFCGDSGSGPWVVVDGRLVDSRKLPHLGDAGRGVTRKLPHLRDTGQGVTRQLPHLGGAGQGRCSEWFAALSARLARVRICSGDWSRVCGPSVTFKHGLTGVFLDPPYSSASGVDSADLYAHAEGSRDVAHAVREWALANGDNPLLRIALCGYDGEHEMPGWTEVQGRSTHGASMGQSKGTTNSARERIWFSPHCLTTQEEVEAQAGLFDTEEQ